jgi:steroid 5-alpha reductase family enzyme
MVFFKIYLEALYVILTVMCLLWLVSIFIRNVSIVDIFWGMGFVLTCAVYFISTTPHGNRNILIMTLVTLWGLRLSIFLAWRNIGKGEDFRYREFRKKYGEKRYWWISFFQTFLLQGLLMWLISAPLLGAQYLHQETALGIMDYIAVIIWIIGISFEAGGDIQLARFRSDPANKGKVLDKGFWKYTRHPNYFGDSAVWWAYALLSVSAGSYLPVLGSLLMTLLIIKVSGVALLEKSLSEKKPQYREYVEKTSAFIPWFPKK